jgi:hypothetical protein
VYTGRNDYGWGTLSFYAPTGTAIKALDIDGCFLGESPGWTIVLQASAATLFSGRVGGCGAFHWNVPSSAWLQWVLRCDFGGGCGDDTATGVRLKAVAVTIEDDYGPTVANAGGVWATSGWLNTAGGVPRVTYDASDASGVSRARLLVDDQLRSSDDDWSNSCDYRQPRPCTNVSGGSFPLHSDGLADGAHTLTLQAWDAAGNLSSVSRTLLVDNTPPLAPEAVIETKGAGNGWTARNEFALQINKPDEHGVAPITTAWVQLCPTDGLRPCTESTPSRIGGDQRAVVVSGLKAPDPADWTARVVLGDAAGNRNPRLDDHSAHLRFDPDPPSVAIGARDPQDPGYLSASVHDSVSGVADGEIELAPHGTQRWRSVPTSVGRAALAAQLDDTSLPNGTYDERVWAKDAAGNISMDTKSAAVAIPFRLGTRLTAGVALKRKKRVRLVSSRRVRYRHAADIRGRLVTPDGQPLANTRLTVTATPAATGARPEVVGAVTTDKDGRFAYRTVARESRQLVFAYQGNSIRRPAKASVNLAVPASSSIRVSRRSLLNGDTVVFRGRLRGGHVPPGGKLVAVEAWVRGVWQPIANVRTDARGSWHASHTFTTVAGRARFRFRLSIPHDALYPFTAGTSRPISVVVRGL